MNTNLDWYDKDEVKDIEDLQSFIKNVIKPLEKEYSSLHHPYVNRNIIGNYINNHDITKPMFEKALIDYGLADHWNQAQSYWNQIWIENL